MLSTHGLLKITYPGGGVGYTSFWAISQAVEKVMREGKHGDWQLEELHLGKKFENIRNEFSVLATDYLTNCREIRPLGEIVPISKWNSNEELEKAKKINKLRLKFEKDEEGSTARLNKLEEPYSKEDGGRKEITHHKLSWHTKGCKSIDVIGGLTELTIW